MTPRPISALLAVLLFGACSGSPGPEPGAEASAAPSARSGPPAGSAPDPSPGGLQRVVRLLTSNPRRDAQAAAECEPDADYTGRSQAYHTVPIDNGNDFNSAREAFETSTTAQTGYTAYATWDPCALTFGLTGSAVGAGDCHGADCPVEDAGESPHTYWVLYLDTDPLSQAGTARPRGLGSPPDRLPFRADFLVEVRLDGRTRQVGDGYTYQGNSQLYDRSSDWRAGLEESWRPQGRDALTIGDNSSSNFIEIAVSREALGDPCAVNVIGWVTDTAADTTFAYWPPPRTGAAADSLMLDHYGFLLIDGQVPNARANLNRTDFSPVADGCAEADGPSE